jgi:hypothetical protein
VSCIKERENLGLRGILEYKREEETKGWRKLHIEEQLTLTSVRCMGQEWWSYASTPLSVFMAWYLIN